MATVNIYNCDWCRKTMKKRPLEVSVNTIYGVEIEKVCLFCSMRREWPTYREETRRKNNCWYGY